jgi:hypothetical protein
MISTAAGHSLPGQTAAKHMKLLLWTAPSGAANTSRARGAGTPLERGSEFTRTTVREAALPPPTNLRSLLEQEHFGEEALWQR